MLMWRVVNCDGKKGREKNNNKINEIWPAPYRSAHQIHCLISIEYKIKWDLKLSSIDYTITFQHSDNNNTNNLDTT